MTMRMARPGAVEVQVDRVIGNKARRTCPPPPRTRRHPASFRRVATVRVAPTQAVAAAVPRRLTLKLRLAPGLYRITVRAHLEGDRVSRPVHRFVRVLRRRAATPHG